MFVLETYAWARREIVRREFRPLEQNHFGINRHIKTALESNARERARE